MISISKEKKDKSFGNTTQWYGKINKIYKNGNHCTLDYFILPVRQADVAFLTLFIGISGGKAWFIIFGTN